MTLSRSPSTQWPNRRQRILALAKSLKDDLEFIDVDEVDGEFYWKICRDDLLDPLSRMAASIAPHILGGEAGVDLSDGDQERVEFLRHFLQTREGFDTDFQRKAIDSLTKFIQTQNLNAPGSEIVAQLPDWVWIPFSHGLRIPIPPRMQAWLLTGTGTVQVGIYSRSVSGDQLELAVATYRDRSRDLPEPGTVSAVSVHIDFELMKEPPLQRHPRWIHTTPCIVVTAGPPLPPEGVIGREFDALVQDRLRWHLELPGSGSKEETSVAIRTWAIGLLMREGDSFQKALRELEPVMGYLELSQEADRQARNRLFSRVLGARSCLGPR
jgi:hypothetical protein